MVYFIRRSGDDCSVIELHPGDREEIIESGLAIGAAENLCVSKMEALRTPAAQPLLDHGAPPAIRRRRRRQLSFTFE